MKRLLALVCLAVLAACGADGEPQAPTLAPTVAPTQPGVTISGDAQIGILSN